MALQGTLDTFSLPDVLRLLATTGKTGCLHLDGDRGRGSVWIDDGTLVGASADRVVEGAPIDEVIFEMLRFDRGSFRFAVDERAPHEEPADLESTLRRATQLLDEWRELEAVVPSLNHRVAMAPELTVEQVTIDADRWQALVAIAGGRPVAELGENLGQGELSVTRTVSDLVELGVAVVEPPGPTRSGSSRRNVTEIGSRRGEEAPRRASRREAASGTDGMPSRVNWARSGETAAATDADPADAGRPRYRTEGSSTVDTGTPRASSNLKLTGRSQDTGGQAATATVTPPSGRPALSSTLAAPTTPPSGSTKATAAPTRPRQAGPARSGRGRARPTAPATTTGPTAPAPSGQTLAMPTPPPRPGPVLPSGSALAATAPELTDDTGGGRLARGPVAVPPPPTRTPPHGLQTGPSLPIPDPPRGPLLPPTLDTGRLGPSALPTDTGQIPTLAASALPPDLSWAAEDTQVPMAPPPGPGGAHRLAPASGQVPAPLPSRMPNGRHDGDPAAHVVAMSPEARTAVENTLGRAGGGQGGGLQQVPGTQEQILGRGHLLHFLSSVRS